MDHRDKPGDDAHLGDRISSQLSLDRKWPGSFPTIRVFKPETFAKLDARHQLGMATGTTQAIPNGYPTFSAQYAAVL